MHQSNVVMYSADLMKETDLDLDTLKPGIYRLIVGPELAKKLIALNTRNYRRFKPHTAQKYMRLMKNGGWEFDGTPIKFWKMVMTDGQHRTYAIMRTGLPQEMIIYWDICPSTLNQDRGQKRNNGDYLNHLGIKNSTNLASLSRLIYLHDIGKWGTQNLSQIALDNQAIIDYAVKYEDALQAAHKLAVSVRRRMETSPSMLAAVIHLGSGRSDVPDSNEIVRWFWNGIKTGENLSDGDPQLALVNKMALDAKSTNRMSGYLVRMITTLAWNKAVKGEQVSGKYGLRMVLVGPNARKPPSKVLVADDWL